MTNEKSGEGGILMSKFKCVGKNKPTSPQTESSAPKPKTYEEIRRALDILGPDFLHSPRPSASGRSVTPDILLAVRKSPGHNSASEESERFRLLNCVRSSPHISLLGNAIDVLDKKVRGMDLQTLQTLTARVELSYRSQTTIQHQEYIAREVVYRVWNPVHLKYENKLIKTGGYDIRAVYKKCAVQDFAYIILTNEHTGISENILPEGRSFIQTAKECETDNLGCMGAVALTLGIAVIIASCFIWMDSYGRCDFVKEPVSEHVSFGPNPGNVNAEGMR